MIKTWKHKGLKKFFESGSTAGIQARHKTILAKQLDFLDSMSDPQELWIFESWGAHKLTGNYKEHWAIAASHGVLSTG
ncbi:type II toxin-antitoxin system RelE/ParE family toxin [Piscirickettsia salmonis]|uniref:type II toxin-antitoxin system RelE/ParE family toxin n=1 Tax=Piscirickettsia salmonis TaxID=1238 RepID=UPI000304706C|nr:type II toxin-antitoxin system RelE/ParE family toxin [Piscirickettsia salmonis]AMA43908.1 hypothetical protein AWJ11_16085 [Piscirickettsia salmonis]AOS37126.1 hypothetical protein AVM72_17415 [Piscirickettsia salmonis]APS62075.1 hypothetical protein AVI53_16030 [Piscirickettsia salmonis]APS65325.1 hypothetical protein AVI54_16025 [Piscirickettsia salmonis]APS68680.1 hypothetical protein AVI55_16605 [Piscirickettsia salmonis]